MNKKLFFIWSMCLLAIMPLLVGCDKDDEEEVELIVLENFENAENVAGEKILYELEDVPAYIYYNSPKHVSISLEQDNGLSPNIPRHIDILLKDWCAEILPRYSKVRVSLSITNVVYYTLSDNFSMDMTLYPVYKGYLKDLEVIEIFD